ncbi:hypothetical protein EDF67_104215 [Sphingobacterium sp. JUb78]|nr:hypothetical protein [Sphingobacterium kitahiroshimense]TCR11122.1 hypothetical protein EDF67_104215 [Sphingobacterium sp. JUb78]
MEDLIKSLEKSLLDFDKESIEKDLTRGLLKYQKILKMILLTSLIRIRTLFSIIRIISLYCQVSPAYSFQYPIIIQTYGES